MYKTFRPKTNFVWAGSAFVLLILFASNSVLLVTNRLQTAAELVVCGILAVVSYLIWIRPKLVLGDDAIEVTNPLSKAMIPYGDVQELDTKWALTIIHTGGKTRVWVAPASGKRKWIADTTFGVFRRGVPLSGSGENDTQVASASLNSLSGQAAYLIQEHMKRRH